MRHLKISTSITTRDSASLDRYLAEISKKEMISAEEEGDLAKRIREGDHEALIRLTTANLRFVVSVAKQYQHQGISLQDLINEGNIGLMKAAQRFDETRGFKFISYAVWWIRQTIMQAVAEQSRMIRLPLNKVGALNKIRRTQASLEQELERPPSVQELAGVLPISEKEIHTTMAAAVFHISTDTVIAGESFLLGDTLADDNMTQPDELLISESRSTEIQRTLSILTPKERDVVVMFYGIGMPHPYTLEEIGVKHEVTRERVRQIKEKAIRRLRQSSNNKNLKVYLG